MLSCIGMSEGYSVIARLLRRERRDLGLSQRELSERSGLTQAQISRIENGIVDMRISSLLALIQALELDFSLNRRSPSRPAAGEERPPKPRRETPAAPGVHGPADTPRRPGIFGDIAEELL